MFNAAFMTSRTQKNLLASPGKGAGPPVEASAKQSRPHRPFTTLKRPATSESATLRDAKAPKSTPALGSVRCTSNAKVAIPRQPPGKTQRYNRRVPRACESCSQRKMKCSGDVPLCRQCQNLRTVCYYPASWSGRLKRSVFDGKFHHSLTNKA
jgi:hypothetical protein